jgi:hypothetical protein
LTKKFYYESYHFIAISVYATPKNSVELVARPDTKAKNANYVSNRTPLVEAAFITLPTGSVQPGGWVRKYLELQREPPTRLNSDSHEIKIP